MRYIYPIVFERLYTSENKIRTELVTQSTKQVLQVQSKYYLKLSTLLCTTMHTPVSVVQGMLNLCTKQVDRQY